MWIPRQRNYQTPPTASAIFKEVPRHQFSISYLATRWLWKLMSWNLLPAIFWDLWEYVFPRAQGQTLCMGDIKYTHPKWSTLQPKLIDYLALAEHVVAIVVCDWTCRAALDSDYRSRGIFFICGVKTGTWVHVTSKIQVPRPANRWLFWVFVCFDDKTFFLYNEAAALEIHSSKIYQDKYKIPSGSSFGVAGLASLAGWPNVLKR